MLLLILFYREMRMGRKLRKREAVGMIVGRQSGLRYILLLSGGRVVFLFPATLPLSGS